MTYLKSNASDAGGSRKRKPARKKITAHQFALNQLAKAGIKAGPNPEAQFRKANKGAVKRRTAEGRPGGSALKSGYSSALAAEGAKRKKAPAASKKKVAAAKGASLYRPGKGK